MSTVHEKKGAKLELRTRFNEQRIHSSTTSLVLQFKLKRISSTMSTRFNHSFNLVLLMNLFRFICLKGVTSHCLTESEDDI